MPVLRGAWPAQPGRLLGSGGGDTHTDVIPVPDADTKLKRSETVKQRA